MLRSAGAIVSKSYQVCACHDKGNSRKRIGVVGDDDHYGYRRKRYQLSQRPQIGQPNPRVPSTRILRIEAKNAAASKI